MTTPSRHSAALACRILLPPALGGHPALSGFLFSLKPYAKAGCLWSLCILRHRTPVAAVQANSADILCAIAHSQPSPLASKLMREQSIRSLLGHATAADSTVVVPALDVCVALLEPRRSSMEQMETQQPANQRTHADAAATMLQVGGRMRAPMAGALRHLSFQGLVL